MKVEQIAKIAHDLDEVIALALREDISQIAWEDETDENRKIWIGFVQFYIDNPDAPAGIRHEKFVNDMIADGWEYGRVIDVDGKRHPWIVPFGQLIGRERIEHYITHQLVRSFSEPSTRN